MLKSAEVLAECEDHTDPTFQSKSFSLICPPVGAKIKIRERYSQIQPGIRATRTKVVRGKEIRHVGVIKECVLRGKWLEVS